MKINRKLFCHYLCKNDWKGPSIWGSLDGYEVCGSGQRQSPIDLRFKKGKFAPPNSTFVDAIHFSTNWWDEIAEGELENNGHTGKVYMI